MPASGVSVQGEDALVVAGMPAAGVGDVGVAGPAEGTGGQVADGGVGVGLVPGADALHVLGEGLVPAFSAGHTGTNRTSSRIILVEP
jgi:hypothetical protein